MSFFHESNIEKRSWGGGDLTERVCVLGSIVKLCEG